MNEYLLFMMSLVNPLTIVEPCDVVDVPEISLPAPPKITLKFEYVVLLPESGIISPVFEPKI